eukprot:4234382-Pyramimonas_sp.AAC.1
MGTRYTAWQSNPRYVSVRTGTEFEPTLQPRGGLFPQVSPYELTTKMAAAAQAKGAKVVIGTAAGFQTEAVAE